MPLYKRSGSHFASGDRQRGTEYFRSGKVYLEIEGSRARARVAGNDKEAYAVGVDWSRVPDQRVLHAFCECQRFASGGPCKHVWATLLALAEEEADKQPGGTGRVALRRDRPASWRDLGVQVTAQAHTAAARKQRTSRRRTTRKVRGAPETWRTHLVAIREEIDRLSVAPEIDDGAPLPGRPGIRLLVNRAASKTHGHLVIDLFERRPGPDGKLGKPKRASVDPDELQLLLTGGDPDLEDDFAVLAALPLENPNQRGRGRNQRRKAAPGDGIKRFQLPPALYSAVLPDLCEQGMLGIWDGRSLNDLKPVKWDGGAPFELTLHLEANDALGARLRGALDRNGDSLPLSLDMLLLPTSEAGAGPTLLLIDDTLATLESELERDLPWITLLSGRDELSIPRSELEDALSSLLELPALPKLEAPEELDLAQERSDLHPRLVLEPGPALEWATPPLTAELSFEYGSIEVSAADPRPAIVDWDERRFLRRDLEAEHDALVCLLELGVKPVVSAQGHELEVSQEELATVAEPLLEAGWTVEVHGRSLHPPSAPNLRVESTIDWFEVQGEMGFAGDSIDFTKVLAAISRGDRFIELEDGSQGLLPESWMETYDSLSKLAHDSTDEGLRFLPSQALLVDGLLAAMPPASVDPAFAELREKLRSFDKIKPKKEPRGFRGELRGYQRDGLGWLDFLREFGLGGVLADDMGLGKTIQVLALIRSHRTASKTTGLPFLVVAPRSLVYNWIDEAGRFTPTMKVVEYRGPGREELQGKLDKYDIVVTTYGTLRRDIGYLSTVEFDTVVLDEAQAIKNPGSQTAKASRLLKGRHRLALTGTPIENHLGELGSIFEFLNPGLLGRLPILEVLMGGRTPSKDELSKVAEGIRPFILRRTKAQVLPDLPPKTEQVLRCKLRGEQQKIYDEVRATYQASLLDQIEAKGVGGSAIQVLEALLRLRQVACHPALVNEEWEEAGSAKLETLFEHVEEVLEEGHKVLVFSQFTKLLALVRKPLDEQGVDYAYLDGQTRNRGEVVERFQTDPECNLFLISLKAGGLGLNLTAAGYVFLLDPWWNPAVEAQAVDRAHRIGQTQPVFTYRMIAEDTVEEKILKLQESKRQIADAILEGEGTSLKDLTADDLKMLLS